MKTIITTTEYWDCDCIRDYIHSKSEKKCKLCGAECSEDYPDSRVNEVLAAGLPLSDEVMKALPNLRAETEKSSKL